MPIYCNILTRIFVCIIIIPHLLYSHRRLAAAQFPVFGYPSLIRFSWSTTREALEKSGACKVKW